MLDIKLSMAVFSLGVAAYLVATFGWSSPTAAPAAAAIGEDLCLPRVPRTAAVDGGETAITIAALHDHGANGAVDAGDDPHAHHRAMMAKKGYQRSEHTYRLHDYRLAGLDGKETSLMQALGTDQPVMVNFIFTTCTTICPVMSGVFAQVQRQLGPASRDVRMVSISIDPEYDTPQRLRDYAQRFRAGPQWAFLTGDTDAIIAVQKAFDVYRGNKMSHEPATFLRRSESDPWVRLDGMASAAEIVAEYRQLAAR